MPFILNRSKNILALEKQPLEPTSAHSVLSVLIGSDMDTSCCFQAVLLLEDCVLDLFFYGIFQQLASIDIAVDNTALSDNSF